MDAGTKQNARYVLLILTIRHRTKKEMRYDAKSKRDVKYHH